jgi:putative PIN family toxin of toxin-antitoxin system
VRFVLDTNVIVSGLNFPGNERRCIELANAEGYELCISQFILEEVADVLRRKFRWEAPRVEQTLGALLNEAIIVEPTIGITAIRRDQDDNRILECALEAHAEYLVTGDKRDLLPLKEFRGTRIVNASEFLATVGKGQ